MEQCQCGLQCSLKVITHGTEHIGTVEVGIQHQHRNLGSSVGNVLVILRIRLDKAGTNHDEGIHTLGQKKIHCALFVGQVVAAAPQDTVVSPLTEIAFYIVDSLCQVDVGTIRTEDTDGIHGIQS